MRLRVVCLALVIPLILTATIFAVPATGGMANLDSFISKVSQFNSAQAESHKVHTIHMTAEKLPNGQLAYKMLSHVVADDSGSTDITTNYSAQASIPGPTIVITEGDEVSLTIHNDITSSPEHLVSVHVHGVHYDIDSDGTLDHINMTGVDQGAYPGGTYTYHWIAGPGTAGSWPYHDHTWGGLNGAEHRGLFGMVIVNPASGTVKASDGSNIADVSLGSIKKDFVLYLGDDAFWGMEIDQTGKQTPLWVNPTLVTKSGDYARFHLIPLGTDMHQFKLSNRNWIDPGTDNLISVKNIGPLENHVFTLKASKSMTQYIDLQDSNNLMGMKGTIKVTNSGGSSIPGPSPL